MFIFNTDATFIMITGFATIFSIVGCTVIAVGAEGIIRAGIERIAGAIRAVFHARTAFPMIAALTRRAIIMITVLIFA